jgi:PEP-CTERM motif
MTGNLLANTQYWLTLGGANDTGFTQFDAWDVNGGPASCDFAVGGVLIGDCGLGQGIEGEAFTLYAQGQTGTPEPGSFLLLGSGVIGLAGVLRRKLSL